MITLSSVTSNRTLHLRLERQDALHIELSGFPVAASASIWTEDNASSLFDFLIALGEPQPPWQDERTWESLEGDFKLSATCSKLGVVRFQIELKGLQGAPEEWQVTAGIESELGLLARIAEEAAQIKTGG